MPSESDAQRSREDLLAPRTQIVADRDAYLGQGRADVGRRISVDQIELFVDGDVGERVEAEFVRHASEFIAVHDVGAPASLRLLGGLAGAAGAPVQRLSVRRQGYGVPLAVLQFVEVPLDNGATLRVYTTDVAADSQARAQLARVLLARSRLGVLLVGPLPPHALTAQLAPLRDAVRTGRWPNRDLLVVPLGASTALAAEAARLGGRTVAVQVTPQAGNPKQVWAYVSGAWNRRQAQPGSRREMPTEIERAVRAPPTPSWEQKTQPMGLTPVATRDLAAPAPAPMPPLPMPVPGSTRWQAYADRCVAIGGAVSCCVFDRHGGEVLASAGGPPPADRLAQHGATLLVAMESAARALGLGAPRADAAITTAGHHLLLQPVAGHPGVVVHLVLLAAAADLPRARAQLERLTPPG